MVLYIIMYFGGGSKWIILFKFLVLGMWMYFLCVLGMFRFVRDMKFSFYGDWILLWKRLNKKMFIFIE